MATRNESVLLFPQKKGGLGNQKSSTPVPIQPYPHPIELTEAIPVLFAIIYYLSIRGKPIT